jgi:hypothetical protein
VVFGAVNRLDYEQLARETGDELEGRLRHLFERYRAEPEDNLLSLLLEKGQEDFASPFPPSFVTFPRSS